MKLAYILSGLHTKQFIRAYADRRLVPSLLLFAMNLNDKSSRFLSRSEEARVRKMTAPMVADFSRITNLNLSPWGYD